MRDFTRPTIVSAREFEHIEVAAGLISQSGELVAYPEVLERELFSVRYKSGRAVFQAGGFLGLIPINEKLSLEVLPKVPLANLERLLSTTAYAPLQLRKFKRHYAEHETSSEPVTAAIIDSFLDAATAVCEGGLYRDYKRFDGSGAYPRGRIDIKRTLLHGAKRKPPFLEFSWHGRDVNNSANQLLKVVLQSLVTDASVSKNQALRRRLAQLLDQFDLVRGDAKSHELLEIVDDLYISRLPVTKAAYPQALSVAKMLLKQTGISFSRSGSNVVLSTMLIDMSAVFEEYLLRVLSARCRAQVLSGRMGPPVGARKRLLDPCAGSTHSTPATPDILLADVENPGRALVLEVKYKAVENVAKRDDINQLIAYVFSYDAEAGVLVLPATNDAAERLECLGTVAGRRIYQYRMRLASANIEEEEREFAETMDVILGTAHFMA
jgi:5-methylcytosine-specific restriction enzyme subunit McrC